VSSESPGLDRRLWIDLGMARAEGGGGGIDALPGMALGWLGVAMMVGDYEVCLLKVESSYRGDAGMKSCRSARRRTGVFMGIVASGGCCGLR
jgi:hypothetical protein